VRIPLSLRAVETIKFFNMTGLRDMCGYRLAYGLLKQYL